MNRSGKKILIVDDDVDFVESVASFLGAHGYDVRSAYDGRQGLKLAKQQKPDLIVIDVMMTERTEGFFTVQELRHTEGLERVPIVVVSALYSTIKEFSISPESGWLEHDEFLPKPLNMEDLLIKIRKRTGSEGNQESTIDKRRPET